MPKYFRIFGLLLIVSAIFFFLSHNNCTKIGLSTLKISSISTLCSQSSWIQMVNWTQFNIDPTNSSKIASKIHWSIWFNGWSIHGKGQQWKRLIINEIETRSIIRSEMSAIFWSGKKIEGELINKSSGKV